MRLCWIGMLLLVQALRADTITFTAGDSVDNAVVLGARDGVLTYEVDGKRYRRRIAEVSDISRIDDTRAADNRVRLVSFERDREKTANRLLTLAITDTPERMREPFVRVYAMEEGDRGERQVRVFQNNRRIDDPTTLFGLPLVDSRTYAEITFLVPGIKPVAWRIEVWIDGTLKAAKSLGEVDVDENWWRLAEKPRRGSLEPVAKPAAVEEAPAAAEAEAPESPVSVTITQTRIKPSLESGTNGVFSVQYQLRSTRVNQAELPQVELFYVTEGDNRRREVKRVAIDQGAGSTIDLGQGGGISRTAEYPLPPGVNINAANRQLASGGNQVTLVFWRVHIGYKDTILAVKQGGDEKVGRSLPEDWWK